MEFIYNLFIRFYYFLIKSAALFNKKAKLWIDGRKNWANTLSEKRKDGETWIWFHCSSLGEYEDCCEIFKQVKKDNPLKKTLLTFFSPSGFEVLKQSVLYDMVMYLPLDTKKNASLFLNILQPESVFFSRSELWLNFLSEIKKKDIPAFLLSLRLNEKSGFIIWPAKVIYKTCFKVFIHIFCQTEITKTILLNHLNIDKTSMTGNTRFDRIYNESLYPKEIPHIINFIKNRFVIVAGSCLPKDEKIILETIEYLKPMNIAWIIVPHEIDGEQIDKTIKIDPLKTIRYSNIDSLDESHIKLYFDHVGDLKHLYKYADLAIIGGGFDKIGIHNIIEPSVYGVQTIFGPNHKNYPEALDLLETSNAHIFNGTKELYEIIKKEFANPSGDSVKEKIINYVKINTGGSLKIIEFIRTEFPGLI